MPNDHPTNGSSGFVCPRCGGALWEQRDGMATSFECRIGDRYAQAELWIDHCVERNRALIMGARVLSENAALARRLAVLANERGDAHVGMRLEEEAREEDRLYEQVRAMVEGLPGTDPGRVA
jgi:two-component system, chemotaxis family, protein-glutamate methylesterase/glutaminase